MIRKALPLLATSLAACLLSASCSRPEERSVPPPSSAPPPGAVAHADHEPKHAGVLFMAADGFHHLEGTYPEEGLFRLYLYDDYTRPLDARAYRGTIRLDAEPENTAIPLDYEEATRTLAARISPPPALPADLVLQLQLRHPKSGETEDSRFDFRFTRVGGEPRATGFGGPHGGQVVHVAGMQVELARMNGVLALYVMDPAGQVLPMEGARVSLMAQPASGAPTTLELAPMGDHFMSGTQVPLQEGGVVVATVQREGRTHVARFTVASE